MTPTLLLRSLSIGAAVALAGCGPEEAQNETGYETGQTEDAMRNEMQTDQTQPPDTASSSSVPEQELADAEPPEPVSTMLVDTDGNEIGNVVIHSLRQGVRVDLHAEGLNPGQHAVHFHATGSCQPPDFKSAGSHYNPADAQHGAPDSDEQMNDQDHHAGDMRNQVADDNGTLDVQLVNQTVSLHGGQNPLLDEDGSALVIHAQPDDYETQPAGDAGNRVACAEITAQA